MLLLLAIAAPVSVGAQSHLNSTPLHWAASHGQADLARKLLDAGADVSALDLIGRTPLHVAVEHPELVKILLANGADVNARDVFRETPLHLAVRYRQSVALLLEAGADVSARDAVGDTPLDKALRHGDDPANLAVINLLVDAGAGTP